MTYTEPFWADLLDLSDDREPKFRRGDHVWTWDDIHELDPIPKATWHNGRIVCSHEGCTNYAKDIILLGINPCHEIRACCWDAHGGPHDECAGHAIPVELLKIEPLRWLGWLAGRKYGPFTVARLLRWLRVAEPLWTVEENRPDRKPCAVYTYFDDDELIYVGVADDFERRDRDHKNRSPWWKYVKSQSVEYLPNREAALLREASLIAEHNPRFNKRGRTA